MTSTSQHEQTSGATTQPITLYSGTSTRFEEMQRRGALLVDNSPLVSYVDGSGRPHCCRLERTEGGKFNLLADNGSAPSHNVLDGRHLSHPLGSFKSPGSARIAWYEHEQWRHDLPYDPQFCAKTADEAISKLGEEPGQLLIVTVGSGADQERIVILGKVSEGGGMCMLTLPTGRMIERPLNEITAVQRAGSDSILYPGDSSWAQALVQEKGSEAKAIQTVALGADVPRYFARYQSLEIAHMENNRAETSELTMLGVRTICNVYNQMVGTYLFGLTTDNELRIISEADILYIQGIAQGAEASTKLDEKKLSVFAVGSPIFTDEPQRKNTTSRPS